jgi:flagellar biosynthesis chaperone FliJ
LTVSGKLSKNNVEDAKYEQKKILSEIKSIKHNLDNIIKDTDDVDSLLNGKNVI